MKIQFSAIVVTYNEDRRLEKCLQSIHFCDQIIVIDIGSTDTSIDIARKYTTEIFSHQLVPVSDFIIPEYISKTKFPWIVRLDPDEVFPIGLLGEVLSAIKDADNIGKVSIPHQYYFLGKKLKYTAWGGIKHIPRIFNKEGGDFISYVHNPYVMKPGFREIIVDKEGKNPIQHYWIDTSSQLLEKHRRYIVAEGKAKFDAGLRFSWFLFVIQSIKALFFSLIRKKGILGGFDGIYLSFFYTWYVAKSLLSLKKYQQLQN
jgi:glycosyltransferase involved in cell wall biosynthesis